MLHALRVTSVLALLSLIPFPLFAQGASVAFGGLKQDTSLPVEVSADNLAVNQADGTAVFSGNVLIGQGKMKISAGKVKVEYTNDGSGISKLFASEGVTLINATDAAEAREAVYTIDSGNVVMTGDVLLTQGGNALSGQKLVINLKAGTGVMEGRVQTVFQPGKAKN
ncbi:lipopolysaccharide transport periplasmic protein LptA [Pseudorhodobacter sp.]|uniref:lipopolysaccharide transport periplasmic protein LptA n=1 Tax=Pseudorhodobacter sp. TaxID=1934400 RepID=UPI0026479C4A|nr:lipopolysaccharide transport periplasmic protein LptA [Pseudorhodobacter sp.]MDN5785777.1 lipopolysaccharide transport periplasmic protein LptA [Pseudorhodobacter sp.]